MRRELAMGAAAGAVGTVALNVVTYLDMVLRARGSSSVPAEVAGALTQRAGLPLSRQGPDSEAAQNRQSGLGALLGYVTGLGVGGVYGVIRPRAPWFPRPLAAVGLGAAAMSGSDVPSALLGITKPGTRSATSWASDVVPHLAYGAFTAIAFDAFAGG